MASKPVAQLSATEKEQLAVSYASFIISSQGADVTADSIKNVLKAANVSASEPLVKAFAKILKGKSATDFIGAVGSGSGSAQPAATSAPAADIKQEKGGKTAPPPPPPAAEEEEMDMGGLFDWFSRTYLNKLWECKLIYHFHILYWFEYPVSFILFEAVCPIFELSFSSVLGMNPSKFGRCSRRSFSFSLLISSSSQEESSFCLKNYCSSRAFACL